MELFKTMFKKYQRSAKESIWQKQSSCGFASLRKVDPSSTSICWSNSDIESESTSDIFVYLYLFSWFFPASCIVAISGYFVWFLYFVIIVNKLFLYQGFVVKTGAFSCANFARLTSYIDNSSGKSMRHFSGTSSSSSMFPVENTSGRRSLNACSVMGCSGSPSSWLGRGKNTT